MYSRMNLLYAEPKRTHFGRNTPGLSTRPNYEDAREEVLKNLGKQPSLWPKSPKKFCIKCFERTCMKQWF